MKHVLIILGYGELGGSEKQAIYLAEELSTRGYKISVLNFGPRGLSNTFLDEKNITNRNIHLQLSSGRIARFRDLIRLYFTILKLRPSAIIPFTHMPNVYANALGPLLPFTRIFWNQRDEGIGAGKTYLEKFALKRADQIIANSVSGKNFLENYYRIRPGSIKVISNGVKIPGINGSVAGFNVGMIGNLHSHKDFKTLLKGWSIFKKMDVPRDAKLFIAGRNDGLLQTLIQLAEELSIADSVIFCGQEKNIHEFINKLHIGVHSSKHEGCPNAILEMMSYGLPVVANSIPGNVGVLGTSYELYFPTGDAEKLAALLFELYKCPAKADNIGKINRVRVKDKFSLHPMILNYESLIR